LNYTIFYKPILYTNIHRKVSRIKIQRAVFNRIEFVVLKFYETQEKCFY